MLQAKKRFWGTRPGFDLGDVLHIGVNVLFALVIYAMVAHWSLLPLAIVLVLLSKWRVLAVQPRFWLPNIKANLVDIIVGISTIGLISQASYSWLALLWTALYVGWLLLLKPQTQDFWVGMQAFWAQLIGLLTLFSVQRLVELPTIVCLLAWVIAWSCARHFFSNYEEAHYRLLSLIWAFLVTQLVWICLHWLQYYKVFNTEIAAVVLILSVISASAGTLYHGYKKEKLHRGSVLENSLFALALIGLILATSPWTPRL